MLSFFVFLPYLNPLIVAAVMAVLFRPLYRLIQKLVGKHDSIATILTVIIVLIVIITPLALIGGKIVSDVTDLYNSLATDRQSLNIVDSATKAVLNVLHKIDPDITAKSFDINLKQYIGNTLSWIAGNLVSLFTGAAQFMMSGIVALIAFYFLLKDGAKFKERLIELSPLSDKYDRDIFKRIQITITSVIRGTLVVAVLQGLLSGAGFAIFKIPNPALWGMVAILASLIPGIGTALVLIPAIIYSVFAGGLLNAVGLAAWSLFIVGLVDNFLKPRLISKSVHIHDVFVLLSVLGGLSLFGPIGFLIGPIVLSLLFALLDIYKNLILRDGRIAETPRIEHG
ncbi:MAG: hypothetical protein CEN90_591 [Parcubacteria group bacterium Licking1014_17]|nr:MAG: hypothetical protein CEN90_591 [Parcubacteria group bacterium Licking1014_17]